MTTLEAIQAIQAIELVNEEIGRRKRVPHSRRLQEIHDTIDAGTAELRRLLGLPDRPPPARPTSAQAQEPDQKQPPLMPHAAGVGRQP